MNIYTGRDKYKYILIVLRLSTSKTLAYNEFKSMPNTSATSNIKEQGRYPYELKCKIWRWAGVETIHPNLY